VLALPRPWSTPCANAAWQTRPRALPQSLGGLAFRTAYPRWVDPANQQEFAELARQALHELKAATTALA